MARRIASHYRDVRQHSNVQELQHTLTAVPRSRRTHKARLVGVHHRRTDLGTTRHFRIPDLMYWFIIPVLLELLLRIFVFGFYVIPSGSMLNTIEIGDRVITNQLAPSVFALHRGDIVVFRDPGGWLSNEGTQFKSEALIKRLIGLPGDVVECDGPGQPVKVNGKAIDESSYIHPGVLPSEFAFRVTVRPNHLFVLGDNRANSADSRYHLENSLHGLVPIDCVQGVALLRYWPLDRFGTLSSHREVFAHVSGVPAVKR